MQLQSSTTPLLTVDGANEDTIRAFEETDSATRNCLATMLLYIVMQMRKTNREKGYYMKKKEKVCTIL